MRLDAPETMNHTSELSFPDCPAVKHKLSLLSDTEGFFPAL